MRIKILPTRTGGKIGENFLPVKISGYMVFFMYAQLGTHRQCTIYTHTVFVSPLETHTHTHKHIYEMYSIPINTALCMSDANTTTFLFATPLPFYHSYSHYHFHSTNVHACNPKIGPGVHF